MAKVTPESRTKKLFKDLVASALTARGVTHKLVYNAGASFGVTTLDCTGVIAGYAVAFEFKRMDKKGKLTGRQKMDLNEFAAAGAVTYVIENEADLAVVANWFYSLPDYRVLMKNPLQWTT